MKVFIQSVTIFLFSISPIFALEIESKQTANTVSYTHVLNWAIGLIIVLALFLGCVWVMKKMGAIPVSTKDNMRVVSALSLGMREKVVLVQIGEKQLLLGVTPARVEKLLLLEGEDKLFQQIKGQGTETDFSSKFKQIMTGTTDE